nr:DUF501 domain-containing protein [uncultured Mobiluncus sp.]
MITPASPEDLRIIAAQLGRVPRGVLGVAARCGDCGENLDNGSAGHSGDISTDRQRGISPGHQAANPVGSPGDNSVGRHTDFPAGQGGGVPAGHPAVIVSAPRLPGGEPFPTFYYLTCPAAVAAVSHLEANGVMREAEALLEANPQIAAAYGRAHELYIRQRTQAGEAAGIGEVPEIAGVSAGGMPRRVKCFHALLGHALAAGRGVNPIGDWVLDRLAELPADNPHRWTPATCAWRLDETAGEGDQ